MPQPLDFWEAARVMVRRVESKRASLDSGMVTCLMLFVAVILLHMTGALRVHEVVGSSSWLRRYIGFWALVDKI